jgi:hypothetical protein
MNMTYHHYTSQPGYEGILNSKKINPSLKGDHSKDVRFGEGQYISDIKPCTKRPRQLSMIFFGIPWAGHRFTHYVSIDATGLDVLCGRQNVFLIKNAQPLDISERLRGHGTNK